MEIFEFLQKHWGLIATVIGSVWAGMKLSMDSKYPSRKEIETLKKDVGEIEHRVTTIEDTLKHLPNKDDLSALKILMTEIKGDISTANTRISTVSHQVNLLVEEKIKG